MSKLHWCSNGNSVTEQVVKYQKSQSNDDFVPISEYYNDYKEVWYQQIEDYLDRDDFDAEFNFKLLRAVDSFNNDKAQELASKNNWSHVGSFNRWFYRDFVELEIQH